MMETFFTFSYYCVSHCQLAPRRSDITAFFRELNTLVTENLQHYKSPTMLIHIKCTGYSKIYSI